MAAPLPLYYITLHDHFWETKCDFWVKLNVHQFYGFCTNITGLYLFLHPCPLVPAWGDHFSISLVQFSIGIILRKVFTQHYSCRLKLTIHVHCTIVIILSKVFFGQVLTQHYIKEVTCQPCGIIIILRKVVCGPPLL